MANNIAAGNQVVYAKQTASFISMGFTPDNIRRITLINPDSSKSYDPNQIINPISGTVANKGYLLNAKIPMDRTEYFQPPFTGGNAITWEDGSSPIESE